MSLINVPSFLRCFVSELYAAKFSNVIIALGIPTLFGDSLLKGPARTLIV